MIFQIMQSQNQRNPFAWILGLGAALVSASAACEDGPLPPEVKALIGMKLAPKVVNVTPEVQIPNFASREWSLLPDVHSEATLAYDEGVIGSKWPAIVLERIYRDQTTEIIDVQLLPENLIEWKFVNGAFKYTKDRYRVGLCKLEGQDRIAQEHIILGLVKPENERTDCSHFSKRVARTWLVDTSNGRMTSMTTQGVQCEYVTLNSCY